VNVSPFAMLAFFAASPPLATSAWALDFLAVPETPPTLTGAGDLLWLWAKVIAFLAFLGSGALLLNHFYKRKRFGVRVNATGKIHLADTLSFVKMIEQEGTRPKKGQESNDLGPQPQ
jgi:hypothetical protein